MIKWIVNFLSKLNLNNFNRMFDFSYEEKLRMPPMHYGCRCVMQKVI